MRNKKIELTNIYMRLRTCTRIVAGVFLTGLITACSLGDLVGKAQLPPDQRDPDAIKNREGAVGAYYATVIGFMNAMGAKSATCDSCGPSARGLSASVIYNVALMTDEYVVENSTIMNSNGFPNSPDAWIDARSESVTGSNQKTNDLFVLLSAVRTRSQEARAALTKYAPGEPAALRGHLHALQGYAEVLLAEIFCSGIPLSNLVFEGDFQYSSGLSTQQVYQSAIAHFDSALNLSTDSARIMDFARMGKARALVGMDELEQAAAIAATIPDSYRYDLTFQQGRVNLFYIANSTFVFYPAEVANREGMNGLPYWSDPRTDTVRTGAGTSIANMRLIPRKFIPEGTMPSTLNIGGTDYQVYFNTGLKSIPIATGIEARLIQAEDALRRGDNSWLTILNQLRTTCTSAASCPSPAPAGIGGVAGLPPLAMPASEDDKVTLLFEERAYWLFLTGYRQGDLRRMIRQYSRFSEDIYPIGLWGPIAISQYGTDVNLAVPQAEIDVNPAYGGCENRDA